VNLHVVCVVFMLVQISLFVPEFGYVSPTWFVVGLINPRYLYFWIEKPTQLVVLVFCFYVLGC
jgi:hypothetical protein